MPRNKLSYCSHCKENSIATRKYLRNGWEKVVEEYCINRGCTYRCTREIIREVKLSDSTTSLQ